MSRIKLIDFAKQNGYNAVSKVRKNTNQYLYVTFLNQQNGALTENIYLGERYAGTVKVGDQLPLAELFVTEVTNAAGEQRMKITDRSGEVSAAKMADYQTF